MSVTAMNRRRFLLTALGCGGWVTFALARASAQARAGFAAHTFGETVGTEPFARVDKIADGVWAVISDATKGNAQTVSNAGIIAGKNATLVVEGTNSAEGGAWIAGLAKELTGRAPDYVVLTHHHPDHSNGACAACAAAQTKLVSLSATRKLLLERQPVADLPAAGADGFASLGTKVLVPDTVIPDGSGAVSLDLGGRTVRLVPRIGHTPGDLTVELDDPRVVWTGDLCFNGLFPFYGDAIPSKLGETTSKLLTEKGALFVPGHGSLAKAEDLAPYLALLEHVGEAAKAAHAAGTPAEKAWETYEIPESLGEWKKFRPDVYRFAFEAWERELKG